MTFINTVINPWLWVNLCAIVLAGSSRVDFLVSPTGYDSPNCGKINPCRTVGFAVSLGKSGVIVGVDGSFGRKVPHGNLSVQITDQNQPIAIEKDVTIVGVNGKPLLTEENLNAETAFILSCNNSKKGPIRLELINLELRLQVLKMKEGQVTIKNCSLYAGDPAISINDAESVDLMILNTVVSHWTNFLNVQDFTNMKLLLDNVTILNGGGIVIKHSKNNERVVDSSLIVEVYNSKFLSMVIDPGINITVSRKSTKVSVRLKNCIFRRGRSPVYLVGYKGFPIQVSLDRCQFIHNFAVYGGGVYLEYAIATITNTLFHKNFAIHSGGALYIKSTQLTRAYNLSFVKNHVLPWTSSKYPYTVSTERFNFYGGAVLLTQDSDAKFSGCIFESNAATFGGAIAHVGNRAEFQNCTFFGPAESHSILGDIILSQARLHLSNVKMSATARDARATVMFHHSPPERNSASPLLSLDSLYLECPTGSNLLKQAIVADHDCPLNFSNSKLMKKKNYCLTMFLHSCKPCPSHQYGIERSNALVTGRDFKVKNVPCYSCPYGGNCTNGEIFGKARFWGFHSMGRVHFVQCPRGYCCTEVTSKQIRHCAQHRGNRLCGRCVHGYVESIPGPSCVRIRDCNFYAFWLSITFGSLLFFVILFYMDVLKTILLNILWNYPILKMTSNFYQNLGRNRRLQNSSLENRVPLIEDQSDSLSHPQEPREGSNTHQGHFASNEAHESSCSSISEREDVSEMSYQVEDKREIRSFSEGTCFFPGLVKILFFFYQVQILLRKDVDQKLDSVWDVVKEETVAIFNMQVVGAQFGLSFCVFPNLTPTGRLLLKPLFAIFILLICLVMYFVRLLIDYNRIDSQRTRLKIWKGRFVHCLLQILLLGYSSVTAATLIPLQCLTVDNGYFTYIDGSIKCYSILQYFLMAVVVVFVIPFVLVPLILTRYLKTSEISLREFFLGLVFPAFAIPFYVIRKRWNLKRKMLTVKGVDEREMLNDTVGEDRYLHGVICYVIEGPFRDKEKGTGFLYWESILIGARLIFMLIAFLPITAMVGLMVSVLGSILLLAIHCCALPFKSGWLNIFQAFMLSNLCIIGVLNSFQASYISSGLAAIGQMQTILENLELAQTIILMIVPVALTCIISLLLLWRITLFIVCIFSIVVKWIYVNLCEILFNVLIRVN